jgi:hypothetical protein
MQTDLSHLAGISAVDLDAIRARLGKMSAAELISFGKQMRGLVYPITYDGDRKPQVSAFSIRLDEARAGRRRRHPHPYAAG